MSVLSRFEGIRAARLTYTRLSAGGRAEGCRLRAGAAVMLPSPVQAAIRVVLDVVSVVVSPLVVDVVQTAIGHPVGAAWPERRRR